jgi:hypothetical protein
MSAGCIFGEGSVDHAPRWRRTQATPAATPESAGVAPEESAVRNIIEPAPSANWQTPGRLETVEQCQAEDRNRVLGLSATGQSVIAFRSGADHAPPTPDQRGVNKLRAVKDGRSTHECKKPDDEPDRVTKSVALPRVL